MITHPYELHENYFIQTVTHYYLGRLVAIYEKELVIEKPSWIADTGRFNAFVAGEIFECECYPPFSRLIINRDAIVSAYQWGFDLPIKST